MKLTRELWANNVQAMGEVNTSIHSFDQREVVKTTEILVFRQIFFLTLVSYG